MRIIYTIVLSFIIFLNSGFAQPRDVWIHRYTEATGGRAGWEFNDIFLTTDGNYALCGRMSFEGNPASGIWVLVIDNEGGIIQNQSYRLEQNDAHATGLTIIETDDRGFIFGGVADRESRPRFSLTKVNLDGEIEWWNHYGGSSGGCYAVIELKAGGFAACGWDREGNGAVMSYAVLLNSRGDLIWERRFGQAQRFNALKETDEGLVLVGNNSFALKLDFNGELLWTLGPNDTGQFNDLTSCDNGFAICGLQSQRIGDLVDVNHRLLKINGEGEVLWDHSYDLGRNETAFDITKTPDNGFLITGQSVREDGGQFYPSIIRTDGNGNLMWTRTDSLLGDIWPQLYKSCIIDYDGSYVVAGSCRPARGGSLGGMVAKIVPERSAPSFIAWSPLDFNVKTLLGDQVEFWVRAVDLQDDTIDYEWSLNGDNLESDDSTVFIEFNTLGESSVQCKITDGDLSDSLRWVVHTFDFYVSAYSPDSLSLTLRRGQSVDFSLDTVRAVEGDPVQYLWRKSNDFGEIEDAGTESRATVAFMQSGHYSVEGLAYRGESSDAVTWSVAVRGVVWNFAPENLTLEVLPDSLIRFEVFPTNPEDTTLSARWFVDDTPAFADTLSIECLFSYPVHSVHNVHLVLSDSIESDTVCWTVTVCDLVVDDKRDAYPTRVELLSVSPNPFNSTLSIRYSGGLETAPTRVAVFDISGREVARLVELSTAVTAPSVTEHREKAVKHGGMTAEHVITWNASNVPAGVYFVRLQSGAEIATKKVVLIR